ncbi:hypothetical protein PROAA_2140010 [Candidatus Propionivibrio aalborgensis]|uniref:Uncharacterized protein n=1 Tax=Candidatus Propionivibrio aalborgensis TaxID=1860101 RepID=A0A1A8XS41_9RHOO|nr:hypothetical protein PROAA_2140010 [Candidatus Propionivibrio aalborgensis]
MTRPAPADAGPAAFARSVAFCECEECFALSGDDEGATLAGTAVWRTCCMPDWERTDS